MLQKITPPTSAGIYGQSVNQDKEEYATWAGAMLKDTDVLNNIYEQDFLECSYGGRPWRSAHQAVARSSCWRPSHHRID